MLRGSYAKLNRGLVGSALVRKLRSDGFNNLLLLERSELDLREQEPVRQWFLKEHPDLVFLVAGTVGGIHANSTRPAEFIYDNLAIHTNVIHSAYLSGVKRLLYLGSSCIYRDVVAPDVRIAFGSTRADGTPRKLLDVRKVHELGWRHEIDLQGGIEATYEWFRNQAALRGVKEAV